MPAGQAGTTEFNSALLSQGKNMGFKLPHFVALGHFLAYFILWLFLLRAFGRTLRTTPRK
jgi:hypothetical protein